VSAVVVRRVGDIETTHELAQVGQRRLYQQVPVIIHQYEAVDPDLIRIDRIRKDTKKRLPVNIVFKL
jgi:hypothetical protein